MLGYEPQVRLEVVGEQRRIELDVADSKKSAAVFCVPMLLTPMFISPETVVCDEKTALFKLKPNTANAIPDGLIPPDKLADEKQLSTVLGRVISVEAMLAAGTKVIVLHAGKRIKTGKKEEQVDNSQIEALAKKYPNQLLLKEISPALYAQHKDKVCAATYSYLKNDQEHQIGIDATQINIADNKHDWGVRREKEAQQKIQNLDILLDQLNLLPIRKIKEADTVQLVAKSQTGQMLRYGFFTAFAVAAAYVGIKLLSKNSTPIANVQPAPSNQPRPT